MRSRLIGSNLFVVLSILLTASVFLFPAYGVQAATYSWDPGTSGTWAWDTSTYNNWYNSISNTDILWPNLTDSVADFGAGNLNGTITGGAVTVASGGVQANAITFDIAGYSLSGGTITMSGTSPSITVATGITETINSVISGSAGLSTTGSLVLNGANNYTGITDIKSGYITIGNDNAFGAAGAGNDIVVESGGGIFNWLTRTIVNKALTLNGIGDGNNMAMHVGGSVRLTWTGPVTLGSDSTIHADGGAGYTFTNNIDGSAGNSGAGASFTVNSDGGATSFVQGNLTLGGGQLILSGGGGTLTLTGAANAWTGGITINTGTLQIGDGGANGSMPDSGTININGTSTLAFNSSNDFTFLNAMISGGGNITKNGINTLTLSGTNYYTGVTNINTGNLKITNAGSLGSSSNVIIAGGTATSMLQLDGSGGDFIEYSKITLTGRSTTAAHIENLAGNNTLADPGYGTGIISLIEGGNQYVIQSDPGVGNFLTISGTIQNNAALTGPRNINFVGAGNGAVTGVIGGGTGNGAINVIKAGNGTWTLSASNTYNGTTTVNAGTLALSSTGSIGSSSVITVNSPAIFDVTAAGFALNYGQTLAGTGTVVGNVADTSSGGVIVAPGGVGTAGTLTFSAGYTLGLVNGAGNVLKFDLGQNTSAASDLLVVNNLDARNPNKIDIDISQLQSTIANGTYPLIRYNTLNLYNGTLANTFTLSRTSITRQTFTLQNTGTEIDLLVSTGAPMNLTWVGTQNGNAWDINTTSNWSNGSSQTYFDGDTVNFTNTGSNSPDINLTTKLSPGSVTFANSTQDYKFIGSGYISGSTGLTLNGASKVTLANYTANDFTGPIAINSGTLQIGDGAYNSGIASSVAITNNGALIIYPASDESIANVISGSGTLTKMGGAVLTLSSSNAYTGATTISAGKLILGNAYALGPASSTGIVTVSDNSTLDLNGLNAGTNASRVLYVQGTGYDTAGAVVNNSATDIYSSFFGVVLNGDTTLGGTARWDIGRTTGAYLTGNGYTLTKTGTNRIILVGLGYTNLGAIVINNGDLCLQGTTIAGSSTTLAPITVNYGGTSSAWGISAAIGNNILVNGGTVGTTLTDAGSATYSGAISVTSLGGYLTNGSTSGTVTFSGQISDDIVADHGLLTKSGSSAVVLTGTTNSWSGGTTISLGTLQIGDGGANGSLPDVAGTSITNGGTLTFNSSNNFTIANALITGTGILTKTGSGTLTLSGQNSYTGATNVNGGNLKITNAYSLGTSSNVTIAGGTVASILQLDGSGGNFSEYSKITLTGRSTSAAHIENLAGNNILADPSTGYGNISLIEGGNSYAIQSDAGLLTITGTIQNNAGTSFNSARTVTFQGVGNGAVSGVIGGGTNTAAINVVKSGAGTWTLSAPNTYTGTTTVNGGTLALSSAGLTSGITVNSTATLDVSAAGIALPSGVSLAGTGTVKGNVADTSSGTVTIIPGALLTPGTLTFTSGTLGLVSGANDVIKFDIGQTPASSSDLIVANTVDARNSNKININFSILGTGVNNGTYPLIQFSNYLGSATPSDNFAISGLPSGRQTFALQKTSSELDLVVTGAAMNLTWVGTQNSNAWDINATTNWSNGSSQTFFDGDTVNFTNTGSNSPNINLTTKVSPGSVTFTNSTQDYKFVGSGNISGSTGLTLNGSGKVTLANSVANDFIGAIAINSGTLQIGDGTNNSGIASTVAITDNGALIIDPATTVSMANVISGSGTLTKLGTGVLTLSASNAYTGATTISAGKIIMGNAFALGPASDTSNVTINSGGTLDLANTTLGTISRVLYVQGTGYDGNGALVSNGSSGSNQSSFLGVNLTGDTTFGGSIRYDIRGTSAYLAGNGYTLNKAGTNSIYLVALGYTNLGAVNINGGTLAAQGSTIFGSSTTLVPITVNSGGTLAVWGISNPVANNITLNNGSVGTVSSDASAATYSGTITVNSTGGTLTAATACTFSGQIIAGTGSGLLTKSGASTAYLTNTSNTWTGGTTLTGTSGNTLSVGNYSGTGASGFLPDTAVGGTITIGSAATLVFNSAFDETLTNATIAGPGSLNQIGLNTVTLSGNTSSTLAINIGTGTGNTAVGKAGALRVTNVNVFNNAGSITFGGGTSGDRLELATTSGTNNTISKAMNFQGREPTPLDMVEPAIVNISGNNTISGAITINSGGNQYNFQTNPGTGNSLTLGALTPSSATRVINLLGDGIGAVTGVIGYNNAGVILTKRGGGTWTLSGVNTYAGPTSIWGGTLALSGSGSIANSSSVNIYNSATFNTGGTFALGAAKTLGGVGTVTGSVTDASGATIAPGNAYNVGQLNISNNLTLAGGDTIDYNASGTSGDLLSVGNTLTLPSSGTTTINFVPTGLVTAGTTFTVAQAGTLAGGNASNIALATTSRAVIGTPVVDTTNKQIKFTVTTGNASLIWNVAGSTSAAWDIKNTQNWTNGGTADMFYQSDAVTFNDPGVYTKTVTLASGVNVAPASITIDGNSSYTFSGTGGSITGSTGINLASTYTGTVTVSTTNNYYGDTVVAGGTLLVTGNLGDNTTVRVTGGTLKLGVDYVALGDNATFSAATATGIGTPTYINGGTLDLNGHYNDNILGSEVFYVQGAGVGGNGAIVNNVGGTGQIYSLRYVRLTGDTTFGGTTRWDLRNDGNSLISGNPVVLTGNNFTLSKTGANDIFFVNIGYTNLGGVVVNQGELTIQADNGALPTVLGSTSTLAPVTVNTGGQFGAWGATTINNTISLAGGGIGATQSDTNAASTFGGAVTLSNGGGYIYNVNSTYTCTFSGAIGGTGNLTKPATLVTANASPANTNGGTIVFSGTAPNTYVGATNVYAGTLQLQKPAGVNAIPGNLNIGAGANGGATVNLYAANQIADTSIVSMVGALSNNAYLDLRGNNETVGGLNSSDAYSVVELQWDNTGINTDSIFTVNTAAANSTFAGVIRDKYQGTGAGKLNLVKSGSGILNVTGTTSYTGNTTVLGGELDVVNLYTPNSTVTVASGSNELVATSIVSNTLTIGAGAVVTIRAIPGGPLSGMGSISAVPEPATWAMLLLAAMGLGIYRRRSR